MTTAIEPIRQQESALAVMEFDREKIDLIKRTICLGATDDELELFIHACKRTGLDPLVRQIHAVKRYDEQRGSVMTIQTGIDGYRLIAERTRRYMPGQKPTYEYNDKGELVCATAYVKKLGPDGQWHVIDADAFFDEYAGHKKGGGLNTMWANKPHIMLSKCAEALALRKAFPAELSGVYTSEEMDQAGNPPNTPQTEPTPPQQPQQPEQPQQPKVQLASEMQVREVKTLVPIVKMEAGTVDKWFAKAGVDTWEQMPAETIAKCIAWLREKSVPPKEPEKPAATPAPATSASDWDAFGDAVAEAAERAGEVDRVAAVLTVLRKKNLNADQLSGVLTAMEKGKFDWQTAQITTASAAA